MVISNGPNNLSPEKDTVFSEMFRVLKPAGQMLIGDILVSNHIPDSAKNNFDLWAGWIAGALLEADLEKKV